MPNTQQMASQLAALASHLADKQNAILVPPFFVRVDVGEDGATGQIACKTGRRAVHCGR